MNHKIFRVNNQQIKSILLLAILAAAIIFSAGCISSDYPIPETTSVEIPDDLHEGIHDIYNDMNYLELTIGEDVHILGEQMMEAETDEEAQTVLIDYYLENPWISSIIYYDAPADNYISVPVHLSDEVMESIPFPTESEIKNAKDGVISHNCVFIYSYGYLNVYTKAVYDEDDNYLGYFTIITDMYLLLNYHPIVTQDDRLYNNYVSFMVDHNGKIIYSSVEEAIGETISEDEPCYIKNILIEKVTGESGAYSYTSDSFYDYDEVVQTEKITAWHTFNKVDYSYTIYLVEEVDRPKLKTENVFNPNPEQLIEEVEDLYIYARNNGIDDAAKYLREGEFNSSLAIFDKEGNVIGSNEFRVGLNYMNNRGVFGYSYMASAITAAEQGGGYIYFTVPIDKTVETEAYQFALVYILPINSEYFIFGKTAGYPDVFLNNDDIRSDLTEFSRYILSDTNTKGIDYVINTVNGITDDAQIKRNVGINTDIDLIAVMDNSGGLHASTKLREHIGDSITNFIDVYGGSTVRRAIMLAENGGGILSNLRENPEKEGYVDLWVLSVEPINDDYFIIIGTVIDTFEDILTPYIQ